MPRTAHFKKLFEPGKIGTMQLKNRLVMTAMGTRLSSETMGVTDRNIDYFAERAKGGVGLIITGFTFVARPGGVVAFPRLSVVSGGYVAGLNRLCDTVHDYGAKLAFQLAYPEISPEGAEFGPSNIPASMPIFGVPMTTPRPMTIEEIQRMVRDFVSGAKIAKLAGADAVQIHAAHGHLVGQFLSPFCNRRSDRYGGSTEARTQVVVDIIKGIKQEVGSDFPIMVKFNHTDYVPGGIEVEEAKVVASILENAGADALEPSAGLTGYSGYAVTPPIYFSPTFNLPKIVKINKAVNVPVIAVGVVTTPEMGEQILSKRQSDFIALGRPLLADPDFPQKAKEGRPDDIRPCIRCCEGCLSRVRQLRSVGCTVNAATGEERKSAIVPALQSKRVLIVGGGPAGMEAARVAALRGHNVTLYDQNKELGGALLLAAIPPHKEEINLFRKYLVNQLAQLKVKIKLGQEVTPRTVRQQKPEVVILATGAVPALPDIPGADLKHVALATDVLLGKVKAGEKVVIIGGGQVGCETAWKLYEDGHKNITIVEVMDDILLVGVPEIARNALEIILRDAGIKTRTSTYVTAITREGVQVMDKKARRGMIEADTVILAVGFKSRNSLEEKLDGEFQVHAIGDCVTPGTIYNAIHRGSFVARQI